MSETVPKTIAVCSFCGAQKTPDTPLIAGNEGMICESCVHLAHQVVANWSHKKKSASMITSLKTPVEIKQHLDQYVIGQDTAKETLAVAVYNHYLRLLNQGSTNECLQETDSTELEKSNVIMAGPSGTGKTLLVKSLAKVIGVPIV
ncbi:MAG TPA: ATP-dependent Clp protease ATP-binding subunit ClpX, partial [Gammaproteobacteria bacterium]|nr:ATP-dependent Clp protease ATP-binding subunit ClpX [Gammaproteobacteria bacterium]